MSNLKENKNFIDDPKGRKWSWGYVKFIGEFTTIDFFIVSVIVLFTIPLFFIIPLWVSFIIAFFNFFLLVLFIKEVKGNKLYELFFDFFKYFFTNKKIIVSQFLESNDDIQIYEVISGFDITNLTNDELEKIDYYFNNFYKKINGDLKIIKTSTTYRLTQSLKDLGNQVLDENKTELSRKIIASYYENLDSFSKNKMPNIYFKFEHMSEIDIEIALKEIESLIEVRKVSIKEWQAIVLLEFDAKKEYKVKRNRIISDDGEIEKTIVKLNFQRNVPSLFLNDFIYNSNTSFVIDFKTPSFEEQQKVKKSIKKWSKTVEDDYVEGKNFIDKVQNASKQEAKNQVMSNYLFGKDDLRFFNTYIIFDHDKESNLSFKKQLEIASLDSQIKTNFSFNPLFSKQFEFFNNVWYQRNERKWFPTNISTITNILPFQNESILNPNGAYIGTVGIANYPFMFHPFRKKGISGFHTGVISKTGGGKSTLLKMLMAADYSIDSTKFMILDPKNEFRIVMDSIGGQTIDVSKLSLNPLKIRITSLQNAEYEILNKLSEIKEFLFILFEREATINGEMVEKISLLLDHIKKFYEYNALSIMEGKEFIFLDLSKWLSTFGINNVHSLIVKFTQGIFSRFNKKDGINFYSNSFNFELLHVKNIKDEAIRNAIMFSIMAKIIDEIYANQEIQTKISLVIDEAGWFFKSDFLAAKIEAIMVEARSFNTKITWATQNITDLINDNQINSKLISIYSNTEHMFLGQIKLPQRQVVNKLMKESGSKELAKTELEWIEDSDLVEDRGKFLYQRGGKNKKIKVDLVNQYVIRSFFFEDYHITNEEN